MPFPKDNDNEDSGEVISLDGSPTGTIDNGGDDGGARSTPEDRGDNFEGSDDGEDGQLSGTDGGAEEGRDAPAARPNAIPKARFDEVNEARKNAQSALEAANAEIERLRTQSPTQPVATAPTFDEDAKEKEYIDAMMDGNTDAALAIRREINANIRAASQQEFNQSLEQNKAANELNIESANALEDYPYLDTEEGGYALDLICVARDADISKGVPAHLALRRAVAAIAPRFMPSDAAPPSRDSTRGSEQQDTRTREALRRGARDSNLQPPALQAGIGTRITGARVDVEKLDEAQFKALSNADKKRLRGD